jgi:hypothetical protein
LRIVDRNGKEGDVLVGGIGSQLGKPEHFLTAKEH